MTPAGFPFPFPPRPVSVAVSSPRFNMVEQLKAQDAAARKLISTGKYFLSKFIPESESNTRLALDWFAEAFIEFLTCGSQQQIESLELMEKAQQEALARYQQEQPSAEENLVKLTEERDRMAEQVQKAEEGIDQFPVSELRPMFEAAVLGPLRRQLEYLEAQISSYQKQMENAAAEAGESPG